jgi:hypothetical protein
MEFGATTSVARAIDSRIPKINCVEWEFRAIDTALEMSSDSM